MLACFRSAVCPPSQPISQRALLTSGEKWPGKPRERVTRPPKTESGDLPHQHLADIVTTMGVRGGSATGVSTAISVALDSSTLHQLTPNSDTITGTFAATHLARRGDDLLAILIRAVPFSRRRTDEGANS
jgi:hypothetical protein